MNRLKKILTGAIMASIMSIIISFQAFAARKIGRATCREKVLNTV